MANFPPLPDDQDLRAWEEARALVERHGINATRVATTRAADFADDSAEALFWRVVAGRTADLLRKRGVIE